MAKQLILSEWADSIHRIVLVGDQSKSRSMMTMINTDPVFFCAGSFARSNQALTEIQKLEPHVVVMDLEMPDMSGIELALVLRRSMPMIKTILLADKHDTEDFNAAMEVGIAGFLAKPFRVQECKCLLRAVSNGCRVVSSSAKMHWGKQFCGSSGNLAFDCNISLRQKTLLEMLAQGKTYKDMAQAYQVSKPTIHKWIHILYTKMGVHSGREAVACWGGRSR